MTDADKPNAAEAARGPRTKPRPWTVWVFLVAGVAMGAWGVARLVVGGADEIGGWLNVTLGVLWLTQSFLFRRQIQRR